MKFNYDEILGAFKPLNLRPTYCFDLLREANKAWKERGATLIDAHYTNDGLVSKIKDADGQEYNVVITPVKTKS